MKRQQGFSLIELAIVLVIVTLLVGGLAMPLAAQIEARRIAETRNAMEAIHDALIGYAMSNTSNGGGILRHYLPCPDTDYNGVEEARDPSNGNCPAVRGGLPWVTLGVKGDDAWGNRYTYAVSLSFSNQNGFVSTPSASAPTPSAATLNAYASAPCSSSVVLNVPVIVVSHGPQGRGARNMNGGTPITPASVGADERQNLNVASGSLPCSNNTSFFVTHSPTEVFDDLVIWLSSNELFNRVCPAGGCF